MKVLKYLLLLFTLVVPFALNSCRKDDPCEGVKEATAYFNFRATLDGYIPAQNYHWYSITRIYGAGLVNFDLEDKSCDSVWWKVGNDPRTFRGKNFSLSFANLGTIDVTCIVYNHKSSVCTNDDGYDTVVRSLELMPFEMSPTKGNYRGYFSNDPGKTLKDIRIDVNPDFPSRLYLLDFPDTSCNYNGLNGSKYVLEVNGRFVHDHRISYIEGNYGLPTTVQCDVKNRTGLYDPEFIDEVPVIKWSEDYSTFEFKFWQRDKSTGDLPMQEVKFIAERIP
ncbi:MAG TPA: hypothetical protein DIW47_04060 [Bacteroidetes bacterium]|nr:hypothetical protein [Bacteroidota bacterium]